MQRIEDGEMFFGGGAVDSECLFADDLTNGLDEAVVASDFTG